MARSRNIKPSFFKDAKVVACSFESRLLFQGLWCLADYTGRLKYVPIELKMEIFPADNVDVENCMNELSEVGLIQIYRDRSGSALVQIHGFTRHQNPHVNERMDKDKNPLPHLPGPEDCGQHDDEEKPDPVQQVKEASGVLSDYYQSDPADSLNLIPSYLFQREKRDRKKRGSRLPADWRPGEELLAWAMNEREDLDMQRVIDSFTDYWRAKTGAAATKLDWDATFRNWVRNERSHNRKGTGSAGCETVSQRIQRQAEEARRRAAAESSG